MPRSHTQRLRLRALRLALSLLVGGAALTVSQAAIHFEMPLGWSAARLADVQASRLSRWVDADRDGIADVEELQIARLYAPLVILHGDDSARPASVAWLVARAPQLSGYSRTARRGSSDASDWVTYVHVFPSSDGGVLVQYWFFYPFNDGPFIFDHEADWEHVTVELDRVRRPVGVWASRHNDNAPGRFRAWPSLRTLDGTHPEILSARGTHASYFDLAEVPWYDRAGRCDELARGDCRHRRWRTWEGGGLRMMGERQAPLDAVLMTRSKPWGRVSLLPGASAPVGPAFQRGWCAGGAPGCGMYGTF
jgi:hypothetical protein